MSYFFLSKKCGLFLLILGGVIVQGCTPTNSSVAHHKFKITDSLISKLSIDTVKPANNRVDLNFSAKISENENLQVAIYPMVSGILGQVTVNVGDRVNKGQLLANVKSADMAGLDKEAVSANAEFKISERALKQAQELYKSGLISTKELEEAKNDFVIKKAELQRAKTALKINGGNTKGEYKITSPISGFVIEKNLNSHMQLRPDNNNVVFKVADLSKVWAIINIYESDFNLIKEGDKADISVLSYPDKIYHGKIDRIYSMVDNESKVIKARVSINNKGLSLKPGMMATVKITTQSDVNLPSVSSKSIIFDDNKNYVLVLEPPHKLRIQEVKIGRKTSDRIYISKGLNPDDKVIASKQVFLFESLKN